jgi:hypothetical protein
MKNKLKYNEVRLLVDFSNLKKLYIQRKKEDMSNSKSNNIMKFSGGFMGL